MAIAGVVGHGVGIVDGEPGVVVFLATPGVAGVWRHDRRDETRA
jgi:hypothetical protein